MATDKDTTCDRRVKLVDRNSKNFAHVHALEQVTRYATCQSKNEENAEGQRGAYAVDYFRVNPSELVFFARY